MENIRPVWAEINLDNLAHNIRGIRKISKSKEIMAVVKADAYGHGAIQAAKTLLENGADKLAVAILEEAIELRKAGVQAPILILGWTPSEQAAKIVEYDLESTVLSYEFAKRLSEESESLGRKTKIHIKFDTGMGRIGYRLSKDSLDEIKKMWDLPGLIFEGAFTHLSSADEVDKSYSILQNKKFQEFLDNLSQAGITFNKRHMGNSATIIDLSEYHYEIVRPGIILYGYYPSEEVNKEHIDLKPVLSLKARISNVKNVDMGEYIGYGRRYKCDKDRVIGTIPIGYADGYSRMLSGKVDVIVKDKRVPVVGRICMDQCMIDITDVENVKIGDEVILIGEKGNNKLNADYIGEILDTISYEVLCMVSKRVPRVYIKNDKVIKIREYV